MPFGQRHVAISVYNICKGHFGSRGESSKNELKDTIFSFPMTNFIIFGVFRMHAQKEYGKVFGMKSTYILNIFFKTSNAFTSNLTHLCQMDFPISIN